MPYQTDVKRVGQILRQGREAAELAQVEVSRRSGIPQQTYSKLERGLSPSPGVREIVSLSEVLDIDIEELVEPFRSNSRCQVEKVA